MDFVTDAFSEVTSSLEGFYMVYRAYVGRGLCTLQGTLVGL